MAEDPIIMSVKNSEAIKALEARMALELKHVSTKLDSIDKKVDEIGKSVSELTKGIPEQISSEIEEKVGNIAEQVNAAVDIKMKSGVFSFVKWIMITFCGSIIVLAAGYLFNTITAGG